MSLRLRGPFIKIFQLCFQGAVSLAQVTAEVVSANPEVGDMGVRERKRGGAETLKKERNESGRKTSGKRQRQQGSSIGCEHPQQV